MDCIYNFKNEKIVLQLSDFNLGSMRNVWKDGTNKVRSDYCEKKFPEKIPIDIELIHSQTIVVVHSKEDVERLKLNETCADGILTDNPNLVPMVTVADCMPIFVWAKSDQVESGIVFGVLHSGWKGTGIASKAVNILVQQFDVKKDEIHFAIGPHIKDCCYIVDSERADYFAQNFTSECVRPIYENPLESEPDGYALSLEKANLAIMNGCGIPDENIHIISECTCCSRDEKGNPKFGSFRREHVLEGKAKFNAMLASIVVK